MRIFLFLVVFTTQVFGQKSDNHDETTPLLLIGDTINWQVKGDTTDSDITDNPILADYILVDQGYTPDSITIEFFVLNSKKSQEYLIIITEVLNLEKTTYCNFVIDVITYELKKNQIIEFNFCSYKTKQNPYIFAVLEQTKFSNFFDKIIKAWEVLPFSKKVVSANIEFVQCSVDKRK